MLTRERKREEHLAWAFPKICNLTSQTASPSQKEVIGDALVGLIHIYWAYMLNKYRIELFHFIVIK
jgi:hypothetical protein